MGQFGKVQVPMRYQFKRKYWPVDVRIIGNRPDLAGIDLRSRYCLTTILVIVNLFKAGKLDVRLNLHIRCILSLSFLLWSNFIGIKCDELLDVPRSGTVEQLGGDMNTGYIGYIGYTLLPHNTQINLSSME